jgi:hypothetical protein
VSTLLIFAQIPGMPIPPLPPGFLWLMVTVGGLAFGISKLFGSSKRRSEEEHMVPIDLFAPYVGDGKQ